MAVALTERAAKEVKKIIEDQKMEPATLLRVGVAGGGCSGFQYSLGFDQKYDEKDVEAKCLARGVQVKVVRLPHVLGDLDGTRKIIERVAERAAEESLYKRKNSE